MYNTQNFQFEKTENGFELRRKNLKNLKLNFVEGLCAADINNHSTPRKREEYLKGFLRPLIAKKEAGGVGFRKFDDRKLRFDKARIKGNFLEISVGSTYFQEYKKDEQRNDEENMDIQKEGLRKLNDRYAFFSRPIGVSAAIRSIDGSIFLGERKNKEHKGCLSFVAGFIKYRKMAKDINLTYDCIREIKEETGIPKKELLSMEFFGIYSNPVTGEVDFTFLVSVNKPDEYFLSGYWKIQASEVEHERFIPIKNYMEVQQLLSSRTLPGQNNRFELFYPVVGLLKDLKIDDFKKQN